MKVVDLEVALEQAQESYERTRNLKKENNRLKQEINYWINRFAEDELSKEEPKQKKSYRPLMSSRYLFDIN